MNTCTLDPTPPPTPGNWMTFKFLRTQRTRNLKLPDTNTYLQKQNCFEQLRFSHLEIKKILKLFKASDAVEFEHLFSLEFNFEMAFNCISGLDVKKVRWAQQSVLNKWNANVQRSLNMKRTLELRTNQQKLQQSRQEYSALCTAVAVLKFIFV